jgi:hypothetical protein
MGIPQPASASLHQDVLFAMGNHLYKEVSCFGVAGNGSQRHFDGDILAVFACLVRFRPIMTMTGKNVLPVSEVQQGPQVAIATQDDMTSASSVTSVRSAFGDEFLPAQMCRTPPALT